MTESEDRSYRALLRAPSIGRVLLAMELGRTAGFMLPIVLVLYALTEYDSPPLAGLLTFLTLFPGYVAAPVVGAMLDRVGRVRLIRLDYVVTAIGTAGVGLIALGGPPTPILLVVVTLVLGVTQLFSDAGLRSLFARLVPSYLWERVNAADSTGYQLATIWGPPLAATVYVVVGAPAALLLIAVLYAAAAIALGSPREPAGVPRETVHIARSALDGLTYVWRNRTLRAIAVSTSITNVCFGIVTILVPIIIVDQLAAPELLVGLAFGLSGILGVSAALAFGRMDTRGRERALIIAGCAGMTLAAVALYPTVGATVVVGVAWILVSMAIFGFAGGVWDIGIFTVRQRRTDPRLMGRAFAISMALNSSGFPIGAALGGWLARDSVALAIGVALIFGVAGTLLGYVMLPRGDVDVPVAGPLSVTAADE